ncbi:hypothetical protein EC973_009354 [Apophysomyces ossiformis]|uniref:Uncharacterized protein n=1 Tax=Apophysomyces ossiformis TaxID=679940 RepID=A0A8H7EVA6_9FUNG|nr:hypothetical protein EC973_009354 [Apophysomyces ossiformis]
MTARSITRIHRNTIHEACRVAQEKERIESRLKRLVALSNDAHQQAYVPSKNQKVATSILDHKIKCIEDEFGSKLYKLEEHEQTVADVFQQLLKDVSEAKSERHNFVKKVIDHAVRYATSKFRAASHTQLESVQYTVRALSLATVDKSENKTILDEIERFRHLAYETLECDKQDLLLPNNPFIQDITRRSHVLSQIIREKVDEAVSVDWEALIYAAMGLHLIGNLFTLYYKHPPSATTSPLTAAFVQEEVSRRIDSANIGELISDSPEMKTLKNSQQQLDEDVQRSLQQIDEFNPEEVWKPPKELLQLEQELESNEKLLQTISSYFSQPLEKHSELPKSESTLELESSLRNLTSGMSEYNYQLVDMKLQQYDQFDDINGELLPLKRKRKRPQLQFDSCEEWIESLENRLRETHAECDPATHPMLQKETYTSFNQSLQTIAETTETHEMFLSKLANPLSETGNISLTDLFLPVIPLPEERIATQVILSGPVYIATDTIARTSVLSKRVKIERRLNAVENSLARLEKKSA